MSIEELKNTNVMIMAKISLKLKGHITYYMKKRFNCDEYGKYFYRESNLRVHIQIVHEKDF